MWNLCPRHGRITIRRRSRAAWVSQGRRYTVGTCWEQTKDSLRPWLSWKAVPPEPPLSPGPHGKTTLHQARTKNTACAVISLAKRSSPLPRGEERGATPRHHRRHPNKSPPLDQRDARKRYESFAESRAGFGPIVSGAPYEYIQQAEWEGPATTDGDKLSHLSLSTVPWTRTATFPRQIMLN